MLDRPSVKRRLPVLVERFLKIETARGTGKVNIATSLAASVVKPASERLAHGPKSVAEQLRQSPCLAR
jgi:hypothetical protein